MSEKIALIGFVNSEQVIADTLKLQTPEVIVDGYSLFPNAAFESAVDNPHLLYSDESLVNNSNISRISTLGYSAINVGPDTAAIMLEDQLNEAGVEYIGPTNKALDFELDKSKIFEIFPNETGVLPNTYIIESADNEEIQRALDTLGNDIVIKFVGSYEDYYHDSVARRVRFINEFTDMNELRSFISNSISSSGKAILQQRITGQEFSYTCLIDHNFGQLRLGENIFYKRRFEGNEGALCDGTGSLAIHNTLPGILDSKNIDFIKSEIVTRYMDSIASYIGKPSRTFLNIDLIKKDDGNIHLLEINHRQPGGHTMATLLSGLKTPLSDILIAAQEDSLNDIEVRYKDGASVAVTVFPEISPKDFGETDIRPVVDIPHNRDDDPVRLFTGWVNLIEKNDNFSRVQSNLTATIIAVAHEKSLIEARKSVYRKISQLALDNTGLTYRTDIGLNVKNLNDFTI